VRRLALLLVAGCFETPEQPRPPEPVPVPVRACTGPHAQVTSAWSLELHDAMPAIGNDRVVSTRGQAWQVTALDRRFDFDKLYDVRVDRDGSIYFRGLWYGNPDQVNNVGDGIFRLDGKHPVPIVDPTTLVPGTNEHFNSAGGFSVDRSWVAFWGGRPYTHTGVYVAHDGKVFAIADSATQVRGTGTPSVRAGRVAFQGEEGGARGIYLWSEAGGVQRVLASPGPIFGGVALGDNVVYAGTFEPRQILAWSAGTRSVAASPEWFKGALDRPILQSDPIARGDDLVVLVAQDTRSELWNVNGCSLERIAGSGDVIDGHTIARVYPLHQDAALPEGDLIFVAILDDTSHHLVRARRAVHTT
jgi:hypothetical protein